MIIHAVHIIPCTHPIYDEGIRGISAQISRPKTAIAITPNIRSTFLMAPISYACELIRGSLVPTDIHVKFEIESRYNMHFWKNRCDLSEVRCV